MAYPPRKIAFVLASTDHGTLIVNRFDYHMVDATSGFGVGYFLLENSSYEQQEGSISDAAAGTAAPAFRRRRRRGRLRRQYRRAHGRVGEGHDRLGLVIAIEAQERIYYALAGNIAINNCFNAHAIHAAVGAQNGALRIPVPNYLAPASFGSLELRQSDANEFIGQAIDYSDRSWRPSG